MRFASDKSATLRKLTDISGFVSTLRAVASALFAASKAIPPADFGLLGADCLTRGGNAMIGLTANSTTEAIYYSTLGSDGQPLTGAKRYSITFKGPIPYAQAIPPGFWSVTMYDGKAALTVENPINRYSLGSDNEMKKNPEPFYLILRNYAPVPEAVEALRNPNAFPMPLIVPAGAEG